MSPRGLDPFLVEKDKSLELYHKYSLNDGASQFICCCAAVNVRYHSSCRFCGDVVANVNAWNANSLVVDKSEVLSRGGLVGDYHPIYLQVSTDLFPASTSVLIISPLRGIV
jgi:hypothetical protein